MVFTVIILIVFIVFLLVTSLVIQILQNAMFQSNMKENTNCMIYKNNRNETVKIKSINKKNNTATIIRKDNTEEDVDLDSLFV